MSFLHADKENLSYADEQKSKQAGHTADKTGNAKPPYPAFWQLGGLALFPTRNEKAARQTSAHYLYAAEHRPASASIRRQKQGRLNTNCFRRPCHEKSADTGYSPRQYYSIKTKTACKPDCRSHPDKCSPDFPRIRQKPAHRPAAHRCRPRFCRSPHHGCDSGTR